MIGSKETKRREPKCGRCRIHGKLEDLALHSQRCPHRYCTCKLCIQHLENKQKTATRIKKYRDEMKEKSRMSRNTRRQIGEPDAGTSHSSHSNRQPLTSSSIPSTQPSTSGSYPPFVYGANYGNLENVEASRPTPPLVHVMQYYPRPFQYSPANPSTSGGYPPLSFGARDERHSQRESGRSEDLQNAETPQPPPSNIYTMPPFLSYFQFPSSYPSANCDNGEHSEARSVENAEASSTQAMRISPTPFPITWGPQSASGGHPLFVFGTSNASGHPELSNLHNVETLQSSSSNMPTMLSHSMPRTYPLTNASYPPPIIGGDYGNPESAQTSRPSPSHVPTIPFYSTPPIYPPTSASSCNPFNHGARMVRRAYENFYSAYPLPYLFHTYPGLGYTQNLPYPPFVPIYIRPSGESTAAAPGTTSNDAASEGSREAATEPVGERSEDEVEV